MAIEDKDSNKKKDIDVLVELFIKTFNSLE